jgi:histone H3/H4
MARASKTATKPAGTAPQRRRLRIPRRLFVDALTFPDIRVRSGGKDHTITFQKAALLALQAAAEERLARVVEQAVQLPDFQHKTLMAADFQTALRLTR